MCASIFWFLVGDNALQHHYLKVCQHGSITDGEVLTRISILPKRTGLSRLLSSMHATSTSYVSPGPFLFFSCSATHSTVLLTHQWCGLCEVASLFPFLSWILIQTSLVTSSAEIRHFHIKHQGWQFCMHESLGFKYAQI